MTLHLYNLDVCPFAQRAKVGLAHKRVPFEETHIDPTAKPAWFLEMNPHGKLPVIVHDGRLVRESAVVLEYLEEVFDEIPMLPVDPYERSQVRLWLQFCNSEYVPAFYRCVLNTDESLRERNAAQMRAAIAGLLEGIETLSDEGPYFLGSELSLLDISFAPFVERHAAVEALAGVAIADDEEYAPLRRWFAAVAEHPAYAPTKRDDAYWVEVYTEYARGLLGRTYFKANPGE